MKKAVIIGASSGIGYEVARLLIAQGWTVGVAARRFEMLATLQNQAPTAKIWKRNSTRKLPIRR